MKIEIKEGKLKHVLEVDGSVENLRKELFATLGDSIPLDKMKLLAGGKFVNVEKDGSLESIGLKDGAKCALMWKDGYRRPEFVRVQSAGTDENSSKDAGGYAKDGGDDAKNAGANSEPVVVDIANEDEKDIVMVFIRHGKSRYWIKTARGASFNEVKKALSSHVGVAPEFHRIIAGGKLVTDVMFVVDCCAAPKASVDAVLMFKAGHHKAVEDMGWIRSRKDELEADLEPRFKDVQRGTKMRTVSTAEAMAQCHDLEDICKDFEREVTGLATSKKDSEEDKTDLGQRLRDFRERVEKFRNGLMHH
jgi:hypothetical protein